MSNASKPIVIEEEPSHEIYASLVGVQSKTYLQYQEREQPNYEARSGTEADRVPETNSITSKPKSLFGKAYVYQYRKARKISKISLGANNKGFQMLTRMGWKEAEGGLGSSRQGTLTPVQTTLKNDKRGIGSGKRGKVQSRVTHHPHGRAQDQQANGQGGSDVLGEHTKKPHKAKIVTQSENMRARKAQLMIRSNLPEEYDKYLGI